MASSGFNWYSGFGPSFFLGDPFAFGVAGEVGLDYAFAGAPIVIGADWRPNFRLAEVWSQCPLEIRGGDGSTPN